LSPVKLVSGNDGSSSKPTPGTYQQYNKTVLNNITSSVSASGQTHLVRFKSYKLQWKL